MIKNNLIKNSIRRSFETGTSKIADKVCYGYLKAPDGSLAINENEAQSVRLIFNRYLSGDSLGKIVNALEEKKVGSPSGKDKWSRKVGDALLSNGGDAGGINQIK
jgi:Recombinase.